MPIIYVARIIFLLFIALFLFPLSPAQAQSAADNSSPVDILPAVTISNDLDFPEDAMETHPPIRLTPDKSEIIRLDRKSRTIIVGNPDHLSILADSSQTLVLVPRMPGATHFTVLDGHGKVIMQRHVIVASPKERYVRVRRSCARSEDDNCQEVSVFFCPDMCHKVNIVSEQSEPGNAGNAEGDITKAATGSDTAAGDEPAP